MIFRVLHAGCFYLELIADARKDKLTTGVTATLLGKATLTHDDSE